MKKLAGYMTSLEVTINIFQFGVGFKDFLRLFYFKRRVNNRPAACNEQSFILLKMDKLHLQYMYILLSVTTGNSTVTLWGTSCLSV